MPVDTEHAEYQAYADAWQRCQDAYDGSKAVKAAGETYLPKLSGANHDYDAYKERALWYGATARTVQGYLGMVFRRDPAVTVPAGHEDFLEDCTLDDLSFHLFAVQVVRQLVVRGRYGVLVDMPEDGEPAHPYLAAYDAPSIVNWHTQRTGSNTELVRIVLQESVDVPDPDDPFEVGTETQYRVLLLVDGVYTQQLWRDTGGEGKSEWVLADERTPKHNGKYLPEIPFWFFGPLDNTSKVQKSPIYDLAEINYSHYRTYADLEHGRHWVALPQPYITGYTDEDGALEIGSSVAWAISSADAKVGMLEFTGQGLQALEKALEQKETHMAVLGARLLEEQKAAAETAEAVRLRQTGEQSVLASIARIASEGLRDVLAYAIEWDNGDPDEVEVALNTEFFDRTMSTSDLRDLVSGWQEGAYSYETLYYNLERGERTRPDVTAEEELALVQGQEEAALRDREPGQEAPTPEEETRVQEQLDRIEKLAV